ncbi:a-factor receptor [Marasmius sp. AFHP31]|nr:a-factor receptor [Marasmius sp. AFHP31]
MTLALVDILFSIPLASYVIYIGSSGLKLSPWISWEDTHYDFGRIVKVPALIWRNNSSSVISVELNRWIGVVCAITFFALFGFANEAKKNYRLAFWSVARIFGYRPQPNKATKPKPSQYQPAGDSLPMYRVSDRKAQSTDADLFKTTVDFTSSFGNSSTTLASPSSPPSYEWPSTPTSPPDTKHLSLSTIHSVDRRTSTSSVPPSSPSTTLEHASPTPAVHAENPSAEDVARPAPVYLPLHTQSEVLPTDLPVSPPFSPVAPYHRPLSPDVYPHSKPFGGF